MKPNRRSFLQSSASAIAASSLFGPASFALKSGSENLKESPTLHKLVEQERRTIQDAMAENGIEGIAVCLIHEGLPVWVEGFGVTKQGGSRVDSNTMFSIQSTSKNLTAVAILLAVQQGLLDLDEPISTYLPKWSVQSRFESAPQDRITLRFLLSHRAGFTHEAPVGNNYDPAFPSFDAHVSSIADTWLRYPVGERYHYSNLGFDLAGYILQTRTGKPFADWVRDALFRPLGMHNATFSSDDYDARTNRAVGHVKGYDTVPLRTPLIPSGGVYISGHDMATYAAFHLGKGTFQGKMLLERRLWDEMHGFALGGDYGLGIIRSEVQYGQTPIRLFGHKGGGFGFGSVFDYCPEAQLAWAAFFNRPVGACYQLGSNLLKGALTAKYGERVPRLRSEELAPIQLTERQLRPLTGNYIGRNASVTLSLRGGSLLKQEDQAQSTLQFTSPTDAFLVNEEQEIMRYRFYTATDKAPLYVECSETEKDLDWNSRHDDSPGPNKPEWRSYLGKYVIYQWGVRALNVTIDLQNGYLCLNDTRLIREVSPGLFFASDGEAVDFRDRQATWKNLRLVQFAGGDATTTR
jgi:CubicO group peptidase (beta-lactamase class C family)